MNLRPQILQALRELHIQAGMLTGETRIKEDLDMDSTELVEMAVILEKLLRITIDDAAFTRLRTIDAIEHFLQTRISIAEPVKE